MHIALESPDQTDVILLIEALDAYQIPLYPVHSHHGVEVADLMHDDVLFAVARADDGQLLACGAIVMAQGIGELKRFYTRPEQRGKGTGQRLLTFLEAAAYQSGCRQFLLETGYLQEEAIALYARCGYERCAAFGDYADDPNSVFMQKSVS